MYGNPSYSFQENNELIEVSINFIWSWEKFTGSLM